jgi:hypothetical protein
VIYEFERPNLADATNEAVDMVREESTGTATRTGSSGW